MANPPPPYSDVTGITRTIMKDNSGETIANYDGNARPGELVVNLLNNDVYIGNVNGGLELINTGGGGAHADPAGPVSSVQLNAGGNLFTGSANLTFVNNTLSVVGNVVANNIVTSNIVSNGTGNVYVTGNLLSSDGYTLGTASNPWNDAFFGPQSISILAEDGNPTNTVVISNDVGNTILSAGGFIVLGNSIPVFEVRALTGQIYSNAQTIIANATQAANTTSGSLQTAGGAGIAKDLYVGGIMYGNDLSVTGNISTGANNISLGNAAGVSQGTWSVAVGYQAGTSNQGSYATAVGPYAGRYNQGDYTTALGQAAGLQSQGTGAISIGQAGYESQGLYAIAIGSGAGDTMQGNNAIAIGYQAGGDHQTANSIILNASGSALESSGIAGLFINPVRNNLTSNTNPVFFNTSTKELTYANTISLSGNITGGNIKTTGSQVISTGYQDGNVDPATGTVLDTTKQVHVLADSNYRLTDGEEGQVCHFVMSTGGSPEDTNVIVDHLRISQNLGSGSGANTRTNVNWQPFPFGAGNYIPTLTTAVFTQGAWNVSRGTFG